MPLATDLTWSRNCWEVTPTHAPPRLIDRAMWWGVLWALSTMASTRLPEVGGGTMAATLNSVFTISPTVGSTAEAVRRLCSSR